MNHARYSLERIVEPDVEPVSLAELKVNLRTFTSVTAADDNLEAKITSAREWLEDYTGRALYDQKWRLTLHGPAGIFAGGDIVGGFPYGQYGRYTGMWHWGSCDGIMLRKSPVIEVTKFATVDSAGAETPINASTYELREAASKWPRIVPLNGATWLSTPVVGDVRIEFRAGFVDQTTSPGTGEVPRRFREAIMLYAEALYDRDEKMMEQLMKAAETMVRSERSDLSVA